MKPKHSDIIVDIQMNKHKYKDTKETGITVNENGCHLY